MIRKVFLLLAFVIPVCFASNNSLAILDIMVSTNDEVELTVRETQYLTDELRRQAILTLSGTTSVLSRDTIIYNLSQSKENISTAVDAGKALEAEYVVSGTVGKFQGLLSLTVELYNVETGKMLGTFVTESENARGLLDTIRERAPALFHIITQPELAVSAQYIGETKKIEAMSGAKSGKSEVPFYVALGLDIVGAAVLGFGIYKEIEAGQIRDDNKLSKYTSKDDFIGNELKYKQEYDKELKRANDARQTGNISLIVGGVLLTGGIAVHIWF